MAQEVATQNHLKRIERLVVAIGDFAGVEIVAFTFAFQVLKKTTLVEGAELEIQRVPLELHCRNCACEYPASLDDLACPACGGQDFEILKGRELMLLKITGERDEQFPSDKGPTQDN